MRGIVQVGNQPPEFAADPAQAQRAAVRIHQQERVGVAFQLAGGRQPVGREMLIRQQVGIGHVAHVHVQVPDGQVRDL
ncbi:hypothetical protein G6F35_010137 [Rhizopus arrhizus]|nr:hypothetical protein G6F35_010137 [Rhizopus arrhizus]